jgi:hypothetical protein
MSRKKRLTIEDAKKVAEALGGTFEERFYVNTKTKYRWKCKKGHQFEQTYANIKYNGNWCPKCKTSDEEWYANNRTKITDYFKKLSV